MLQGRSGELIGQAIRERPLAFSPGLSRNRGPRGASTTQSPCPGWRPPVPLRASRCKQESLVDQSRREKWRCSAAKRGQTGIASP